MISTPLRMEKPVRRPIVPPIKPNWASIVTLGVTGFPKLDVFLENSQMAFDP